MKPLYYQDECGRESAVLDCEFVVNRRFYVYEALSDMGVVFGGTLAGIDVQWNNMLTSTAGRFMYGRVFDLSKCRIELSTSLITSHWRMFNTLAHEMCHAMTYIHNRSLEHHGNNFYKWADRVMDAFPGLNIKRCHNYRIVGRFKYRCCNPECGAPLLFRNKLKAPRREWCPKCCITGLEFVGATKKK